MTGSRSGASARSWSCPTSIGIVAVGALGALTLASCSGPTHRNQSLRELYRDPLLTTAPPGVGEVQDERQTKDCDQSGGEPTWTLNRALDGDGQDVLDLYRSMALRTGWEVVTDAPFDPTEPFEGRTANLVLHRAGEVEATTTLVVTVDVGSGPGGAPPAVTVNGRLEGTAFCD